MKKEYTLEFLYTEFLKIHPLECDFKINSYIKFMNNLNKHLTDESIRLGDKYSKKETLYNYFEEDDCNILCANINYEYLEKLYDNIMSLTTNHKKIQNLIQLTRAYDIYNINNNIYIIKYILNNISLDMQEKNTDNNYNDESDFSKYYYLACKQTLQILEINKIVVKYNDNINILINKQDYKFKNLYKTYSDIIDNSFINLGSEEINLTYIDDHGEINYKYIQPQLYLYFDFVSFNFKDILYNNDDTIEYDGVSIFASFDYNIKLFPNIQDKINTIEKKYDQIIKDCSTINYHYSFGDKPKKHEDKYIQQFISLTQFEDTLNIQYKRLEENINVISDIVLYIYTTLFSEINNINQYNKLKKLGEQ